MECKHKRKENKTISYFSLPFHRKGKYNTYNSICEYNFIIIFKIKTLNIINIIIIECFFIFLKSKFVFVTLNTNIYNHLL